MLPLKRALLFLVILCIKEAILIATTSPCCNNNVKSKVWNFNRSKCGRVISRVSINNVKKIGYFECIGIEDYNSSIFCNINVESDRFQTRGPYEFKNAQNLDFDISNIGVAIARYKEVEKDTGKIFLNVEVFNIFCYIRNLADICEDRNTVGRFELVPFSTYNINVYPGGNLDVIIKSNAYPSCNGTYCVITYDDYAEKIHDARPLLPKNILEDGNFTQLFYHSDDSSLSSGYFAVFSGENYTRIYTVQPKINFTISTDLPTDREYTIHSAVVNKSPILLVCTNTDTKCKLMDKDFNIKLNVTLPRKHTLLKNVFITEDGGFILWNTLNPSPRYVVHYITKFYANGSNKKYALFDQEDCPDISVRIYERGRSYCFASYCTNSTALKENELCTGRF